MTLQAVNPVVPQESAPASFPFGTVVGNDFMIVRPLKRGSMGSVYLAEQLSTAAQRALKILAPDYATDATLFKRFERESQVSSRIPSEHVAKVVAAGVDAKRQVPWIAMEFLDGQTLGDYVEETGPVPLAKARSIFEQLCHALGAAHRMGVVHRDLKPSNVFLSASQRVGSDTTVKVLDFGIARIVEEHLTLVGAPMLGTLHWMAPEQALGDAISPAADVWALGLLAFYVLTGRRFWRGAPTKGNDGTVMREICHDPIPIASVRALEFGCFEHVPPGFNEWFALCVARAPSERFMTADAAHAALARVLA